jgi:hypothetical protein
MFRLWLSALVLSLAAFPATAADPIKIASFNVKWIGYYPERDDEFLAELMSQFDIVVVQELVAPPYPAKYPNGKKVKPDPQSAEFFNAMKEQGFKSILSPEDTGPGDKNHRNNASTEWFVAFYRDDKVELAEDLFSGFIAKDLTANEDYRQPHGNAAPMSWLRSQSGSMKMITLRRRISSFWATPTFSRATSWKRSGQWASLP